MSKVSRTSRLGKTVEASVGDDGKLTIKVDEQEVILTPTTDWANATSADMDAIKCGIGILMDSLAGISQTDLILAAHDAAMGADA